MCFRIAAGIVLSITCLFTADAVKAQMQPLVQGNWFTVSQFRQPDVALDGQTFEIYDVIVSVNEGSTGVVHTLDQVRFDGVNQVWAFTFGGPFTTPNSLLLNQIEVIPGGYEAIDSHFLHTPSDFAANRGISSETSSQDNPYTLNSSPSGYPLIHGVGSLEFYAPDGRFFGLSQSARRDDYPLARLVRASGSPQIRGSFGVIGDVNGETTPLEEFSIELGIHSDPGLIEGLRIGGYTRMASALEMFFPDVESVDHTVFAPTDEAFEAAEANGLEITEDIVMHHIVAGWMDSSTLQSIAAAGGTLTALSGRELQLNPGSIVITPAYFSGGATLTETDISWFSASIAHGLDTVIPEPATGLLALLMFSLVLLKRRER